MVPSWLERYERKAGVRRLFELDVTNPDAEVAGRRNRCQANYPSGQGVSLARPNLDPVRLLVARCNDLTRTQRGRPRHPPSIAAKRFECLHAPC